MSKYKLTQHDWAEDNESPIFKETVIEAVGFRFESHILVFFNSEGHSIKAFASFDSVEKIEE